MGVVLLQAGVYPRAEKEFRAVLAVEFDNDEATLGLAAALRGQGKRDSQGPYLEAEKLLRSILERTPHHVDATFNLAVLYANYLGKTAEARPLLQRFLDDAPDKHPGRPLAEKLMAGTVAAKTDTAEPAKAGAGKPGAPAGAKKPVSPRKASSSPAKKK